jgi:hypothetical protein
MSFTIHGTDFSQVGDGIGLFDLAFDPGAAEEDVAAYKIKGVDGEYSSYGGSAGRTMRCRVRSAHSSRANALHALNEFVASLRAKTFDIVGPDGTTYVRCRLLSFRLLRAVNTGRAGNNTPRVWLDAELDLGSHAG